MKQPKFVRDYLEKQQGIPPNFLDNNPLLVEQINIEYEDGELGRMWDIFLWNILYKINENFYLIESLVEWFIYTVDIYNFANVDVIDVNSMVESLERVRKYKNKPNKVEQAHFWNFIGMNRYSTRHRGLFSVSRTRLVEENMEPFIYQTDRNNDDVYKFCAWFVRFFGAVNYHFSAKAYYSNNEEFRLKKIRFYDLVISGAVKPTYIDGSPMPIEVVKERVFSNKNDWWEDK